MIRHILVPLDGSHFAEHAIPYAVSVAERSGATLELTSVSIPPFSSTHVRGVRMFDEAERRAGAVAHERYLTECGGRIRANYRHTTSESVLLGSVFERLIEHVAHSAADLVVMTTHGGGSPATSWLGSVTDRMVRECPVPLLLVRPTAASDTMTALPALRRILVPCDGSPSAARALRSAVGLAALFDGEVLLFGVVTASSSLALRSLAEPSDAEAQAIASERAALHDELSAHAAPHVAAGAKISVLVEPHSHAATAIAEVSARKRVDLISMSTHGRGAVGRFFLGSVSDKVLRTSVVPILLSGPAVH